MGAGSGDGPDFTSISAKEDEIGMEENFTRKQVLIDLNELRFSGGAESKKSP